jgi:hypothetical protein
MTADRVVSVSVVTGILDTIRTRVLTFALEIEEEAPEAGETGPGTVSKERLTQIFNTFIYGDQATVAAAGRDVVQHAAQLPSAWTALRTELEALGVEHADLEELEEAIRADGSETAGLGTETQGWLGRMTARMAAGATHIGTGATAEVLGGILLRHLGG